MRRRAAFALAPSSANTIYAVSKLQLVFRSIDGGASWDPSGSVAGNQLLLSFRYVASELGLFRLERVR